MNSGDSGLPDWLKLSSAKILRYGENPHQEAVLFKENFDEIFKVLHGKELSYNNLLDIDAAYSIINEFEDDEPACSDGKATERWSDLRDKDL